MDEELKKLLAAAKTLNENLTKELEKAAEERKALGRVSAETQEKCDKLEKAVGDAVAAGQKRWDDIEAKINRGELFGAGGKEDPIKAECEAFNRNMRMDLAARGHIGSRRPLDVEGYKAYKVAFSAYLRRGKAAEMAPEFMAALSVGSDPDGGYFVPADMQARIIKQVFETSPLRGLASIITTSRDRVQFPLDLDEFAHGGWVGETGTRANSNTAKVGEAEIPVHEHYSMPLVSKNLLADADFDVEAWIGQKVGDALGRAENVAFVTGDGVAKPKGFTTYAAGTPTASDWKKIERVNTGAASSFAADPDGPDVFIDLLGALKQGYAPNAWAMKRTTLTAARKLKDENGQYQLVQVSAGAGRPGFEIMGLPVVLMDAMDALGANKLPVALADWKEAYTIVDRAGISLIRDEYSKKTTGQVEILFSKRVGGAVLNTEAIKLAKCATNS